jgi:hypothetical protein
VDGGYEAFFNKGELIGLKSLARFAAKVPGVANAKIGLVLKAIYEEYGEMGISRSTFKRMILKASEIVFSLYMKLCGRTVLYRWFFADNGILDY